MAAAAGRFTVLRCIVIFSKNGKIGTSEKLTEKPGFS